jgi:hypothetical protein
MNSELNAKRLSHPAADQVGRQFGQPEVEKNLLRAGNVA